MSQEHQEIIQDLLSIYFTKRESPDMFEVDTVERALTMVKDSMDIGTYESYEYWVDKYKGSSDFMVE
jgi:hypothetical protein